MVTASSSTHPIGPGGVPPGAGQRIELHPTRDPRRYPASTGRILHFLPRAASAVVLLIAGVVLAGWSLDDPVLRSGLPGLVAMNPATAICFAFAAIALWLQTGKPEPAPALPVARACAITVVVVALLVLARYLLAWEVGPDQLLFRNQLTSAAVHGAPTAWPRTPPSDSCWWA